ncbi:MAG TPA: STY0301 family protein [Thermoanaerobaculia bacterium]|jgi:hypothetical protein|nr:STY0301 family protein [Thermoanaerobaculia bacterium]
MKTLLIAGLMMIVLVSSPAVAAELTCPTAPHSDDWQGFRVEPTQIRLLKNEEVPKVLGAVEGVSIFDGSPPEMADLVPDNPEAFGKAPLVWSFTDDMKRGLWVICRYKKTTVAFGKALPPGVRSCRVEGAPGKVFKIRCK